MLLEVLHHRHRVVFSVSEARDVISYGDTTLHLLVKDVAFVEEEDDLRFGKDGGRAYDAPEL